MSYVKSKILLIRPAVGHDLSTFPTHLHTLNESEDAVMLLTQKKKPTKQSAKATVDPYTEIERARQQKQARTHYVHRVHKRRIILLFTLLAAIFLVCGVQIYQARQSLATTNAQVATKKVKLKKNQAQQRKLKLQESQLKNDDYLQQVIRQKYYYSKNNETIYSLPQDKAPTIPTK
ncbi:FtsB family cell division protein [Loigolactobacillus coryniformis]|uniref:FtsB family cell division protein n=1 Tax=Loigolactobacillus coryniformis TaxID=1610 RepID=UPI0023412034|nr:septum formation initiator family protein [Loigolactobacillus coryniformis]